MKRRTVLGMGLATAAAAAFPANAQQPPRIVSVGSSITEIVYALGADKMLVGVDTTSLYPKAARKLPLMKMPRRVTVPAESGAEPFIHDFLMTPEGLELAALFPKIRRGRVRRRILDLVRSMAEEEESDAAEA